MPSGQQSPTDPENMVVTNAKFRKAPIYAALLICEAFIAFGLGVFGNKVADLLKISAGTIGVGALLAILALYLITLARLRYEAGLSVLPAIQASQLKQSILNTATTVFPAGIVAGLSVSLLSMMFLPGRYALRFWMIRTHDYEVVPFVLVLVLLILIARRNHRRLILIMFAVGYGLGAAASVQLMYPSENAVSATFLWTPTSVIVIALIVSTRWFSQLMENFEQIMKSN